MLAQRCALGGITINRPICINLRTIQFGTFVSLPRRCQTLAVAGTGLQPHFEVK